MTEMSTTSIETWAIVEIMGQNKAAGFVKTEAFGGTVMLRIDVPEVPERKRERTGYRDADGNYSNSLQKFEETLPAEPGHTEYVGMSSIFRLRPCTEETARAAVEAMRREKPKLLHVGPVAEPAKLPAPESEIEDEMITDDYEDEEEDR